MTSTAKGAAAHGYIVTYPSGSRLYKDCPRFVLGDVCHSLSMVCRYGGHVRKFYSVAEHSLLVAWIVDTLHGWRHGCPADSLIRREALLHDAIESGIADIVKPYKVSLPDYCELEAFLDRTLREQAGLHAYASPLVKEADLIALLMESYHLTTHRGDEIEAPEEVIVLSSALMNVWPGFELYAPGAAAPILHDAIKATYPCQPHW